MSVSTSTSGLTEMSHNVHPVPASLSVLFIDAAFLPHTSLLGFAQLLLLYLGFPSSPTVILTGVNGQLGLQIITDRLQGLGLICQQSIQTFSHPLEQ